MVIRYYTFIRVVPFLLLNELIQNSHVKVHTVKEVSEDQSLYHDL
jgi:hypothetical protein